MKTRSFTKIHSSTVKILTYKKSNEVYTVEQGGTDFRFFDFWSKKQQWTVFDYFCDKLIRLSQKEKRWTKNGNGVHQTSPNHYSRNDIVDV